MTVGIIGVAGVILLCVLAEKFSDKLGMPALILFMFIGMLFGSDGIFKIYFSNSVYHSFQRFTIFLKNYFRKENNPRNRLIPRVFDNPHSG